MNLRKKWARPKLANPSDLAIAPSDLVVAPNNMVVTPNDLTIDEVLINTLLANVLWDLEGLL